MERRNRGFSWSLYRHSTAAKRYCSSLYHVEVTARFCHKFGAYFLVKYRIQRVPFRTLIAKLHYFACNFPLCPLSEAYLFSLQSSRLLFVVLSAAV